MAGLTPLQQIVNASDDVQEATVQIPVELLRRAEVAMSNLADIGSNDAEHDVLGELVSLAGPSFSGQDWHFTASFRSPDATSGEVEQAIDETCHMDIPDMVEVEVTDGHVYVRVDYEPLGVAQRVLAFVFEAMLTRWPNTELIAVDGP